jgi:hypothetical protein
MLKGSSICTSPGRTLVILASIVVIASLETEAVLYASLKILINWIKFLHCDSNGCSLIRIVVFNNNDQSVTDNGYYPGAYVE